VFPMDFSTLDITVPLVFHGTRDGELSIAID
jgi:hypothetical protein